MSIIADLVRNPDPEKPFSVVRDRLIDEFELSESRRIRAILQELSLADSKPSAFLRHMRELSGNAFSEEVLKSIWLSHMPTSVQSVLTVSSENSDTLASLADKIFEVTSLAPSTSEVQKNSLEAKIDKLACEMAELKLQVESLSGKQRGNSKYRSRSRGRSFSKVKPAHKSKETCNNDVNDTLCWYHQKYAEKAHKCIKPCSYLN